MSLTETSPLLRIRRMSPTGYKYVGKRHPLDCIANSADQFEKIPEFYWWVPEDRAKVWTSVAYLKQLVSRAKYQDDDTFSRLEVVDQHGNTAPLDEVCPVGRNRHQKRY